MIDADDSFIGRAVELDAIAAAAADARTGSANVVLVGGSAGAGKSTLVRRAVAACPDFQVLTAAADVQWVEQPELDVSGHLAT